MHASGSILFYPCKDMEKSGFPLTQIIHSLSIGLYNDSIFVIIEATHVFVNNEKHYQWPTFNVL